MTTRYLKGLLLALVLPLAFLVGGAQADPLDPDDAFAVQSLALDGDTLLVSWDIHPDYYMYRDKFRFESTTDGVAFGEPHFPDGTVEEDEFFGRVETYRGRLDVEIPVERDDAGPVTVEFIAHSQGCNDPAGVCYPPHQQTLSVDLPATGEEAADRPAESTDAAADPAGDDAAAEAPVSEQERLAASLADGNAWIIVLTFFGLGLLLAFTPCVFPMIPILSSIIAGEGDNITTRRAFTMSLVYVLAMAVTYTVAGVIAGLFGENLQAAFQNPWILGTFAGIFVLLALSMFGFYDLQLPSSMQSKLTEVSNRQRGGTLTGVGVMGFLSALIVGPCVAAPLMGALIYIGQTGDAVLGGLALFAMSLGMGAPLLAIGTSAGKLLPKAGPWMSAVKAVFGVLLLAVALWMLERILPGPVALGLWAALLVISAVYLGALEPVPEGSSGWRRLWKGLGVLLLVYGVFLMIGSATGGNDPTRPFAAVNLGGGQATEELSFRSVKTVADVEETVAEASEAGRPVMLVYTADWCVSCRELERDTYPDPDVQSILAENDTVLIKADVTANDSDDRALLREFGVIGPPALLFFDSDGEERRSDRVVGFMGPTEFSDHLRRVLN